MPCICYKSTIRGPALLILFYLAKVLNITMHRMPNYESRVEFVNPLTFTHIVPTVKNKRQVYPRYGIHDERVKYKSVEFIEYHDDEDVVMEYIGLGRRKSQKVQFRVRLHLTGLVRCSEILN